MLKLTTNTTTKMWLIFISFCQMVIRSREICKDLAYHNDALTRLIYHKIEPTGSAATAAQTCMRGIHQNNSAACEFQQVSCQYLQDWVKEVRAEWWIWRRWGMYTGRTHLVFFNTNKCCLEITMKCEHVSGFVCANIYYRLLKVILRKQCNLYVYNIQF